MKIEILMSKKAEETHENPIKIRMILRATGHLEDSGILPRGSQGVLQGPAVLLHGGQDDLRVLPGERSWMIHGKCKSFRLLESSRNEYIKSLIQ